jgi:hypothetical protein
MFKPSRIQFVLLLPLLFVSLHASDVLADIIVEVDTSDLSAVTFTTTEAFAESSFQADSGNGITLKDFFVGNLTTVTATSSGDISVFDAADGSSRRPLPLIWIANFNGGFTPQDISFYSAAATEDTFTLENQRALTGSAVFDLTTFSGLPADGTVGNIYFGRPDDNQVIGQWRITAVPEPSAGVILSIWTLMAVRRKRSALMLHHSIQ